MATLEKETNLNIGSGDGYILGYINIDVEAKYKPDVVADFRTLNYSNVNRIEARHILEHFGRDESIEVLKQWHSWLKPGGTLLLEVPDFEELCRRFIFGKEPGSATGDKYWIVRSVYGSQEADWAFHREGYWEEKFEKLLPRLRFKVKLIKKTKRRTTDKGIRIALPNLTVVAEKI